MSSMPTVSDRRTIQIPSELHRRLKVAAAEDSVLVSQLISHLIEAYLTVRAK